MKKFLTLRQIIRDGVIPVYITDNVMLTNGPYGPLYRVLGPENGKIPYGALLHSIESVDGYNVPIPMIEYSDPKRNAGYRSGLAIALERFTSDKAVWRVGSRKGISEFLKREVRWSNSPERFLYWGRPKEIEINVMFEEDTLERIRRDLEEQRRKERRIAEELYNQTCDGFMAVPQFKEKDLTIDYLRDSVLEVLMTSKSAVNVENMSMLFKQLASSSTGKHISEDIEKLSESLDSIASKWGVISIFPAVLRRKFIRFLLTQD